MALLQDIPGIGEADPNHEVGFFMNMLVEEAAGVRDPYLAAFEPNHNQYQFGRPEGPEDEKSTFNKTCTTIHAFVDMAIKSPPVITLKAACVGDPPDWYLIDPPVANPSDPSAVAQSPIDISQPIDPRMGAALPPESVVRVDLECAVEYYQSIFDIQWERARTNQFLRDNVFYTQLDGWQFALYEWDDTEKKHILSNPPAQQWYVDPTVTDVKDMAYVGFDWPMDAELAKRRYPQLKGVIDEHAQYDVWRPAGATNYSAIFTDPNYQRGIVTIRTMWVRNQRCVLTPEQAIGRGIVRKEQVPDTSPQGTLLGRVMEFAGKAVSRVGTALGVMEEGDEAQPDPDAAEEGAEGGEQGADAPAEGDAAETPATPMRDAYIHAQTGVEITPDHESWPCDVCLRRTMLIADQVVDDRRATTWDIPVARNCNVPTPRRPFGRGEPERLRSEQRDLNSTVDAMVVHVQNYRAPAMIGDKSMKEELGPKFKNAHAIPGLIFWADFSMLTPGQQPFQVFQPPPLPPSVIQVKNDLERSMDVTAGYSEVSQGQSVDLSGTAIAQLQAAATSTASFRFLYFEETVWRIANLMHHSHVWRMSVEDLMRFNRRYPAHIVAAIRQKAQVSEISINVKVSSNAAQMKVQEDAQTMQKLQLGIIDMETARDRLGEDHTEIQQRINSQQQNVPAAVAGAAA